MTGRLNYIPDHIIILSKRIGLTLLMLTLTRGLFYAFNHSLFSGVSPMDFVAGVWFDLMAIALFMSPYILLYLLPINIRHTKPYKVVSRISFMFFHCTMVGLNLMDIEYFNYTSKRSTVDLFSILGAGSDFSQLITTFITDFWYLIVSFILIIYITNRLYTRIGEPQKWSIFRPSLIRNIIGLLGGVFFIIVVGRGGFQLRPIGILEAAKFTKPENTALVMNTPFSMMKSYGQKELELKSYFSEKDELQLFTPIHTSKAQNILPNKTNVVILILESFGDEFVGFYNDGVSYTPFLDSILTNSLTFSYGIANGKKSIEALPSIMASIPSLMDNPYISSQYGSNKIKGLPKLLGEFGYESAFFHGATNGSMRFDAFANFAGFDHYIGRSEYNNDDHFDETWGILDEYFNPWAAKQMTQLKEPFFAGLFTLSSHHPYFIPEHMKSKVIKGPQKIATSISYGDLSLRAFFEEAQKQPWYNHTLFVICADHTPATKTKLYNQRTHMYQIPIAFYDPSGKLKAEKQERIVQQLDIYPTILDLLNINTKYYSFGNSIYQNPNNEAISYLEGTYYYFKNNHMLSFTGEKARNLYDFTVRNTSKVDSLQLLPTEVEAYENRLKALIQRYNRDLIQNQTAVE